MEENRVLELQRETPVYDTVDVLVLGAGPAGWGAAISAAREGAKTLLVEGSSDIGGVATTGLMSHWTGNTTGGIYEEIVERTHHVYGKNPKLNDQEMRKYIDHETMKTRALQMMREAGVKLLLNTMACEPYLEEDRLAGVFVENKSGRSLIRAKVSIDCTGDGDIAARAGEPYFKGRESDGAMQPMTLMVQVGGVDVEVTERIDDTDADNTTDNPNGKRIIIEEGLQHLDGEQALVFARSRAFVDGDFTRTANQRKLIMALVNKVLDMPVTELPGVIQGAAKCVTTDLSVTDIVALAEQFKGKGDLTVYSAMAPTVFMDQLVNGQSFVLNDPTATKQMMKTIEEGGDPSTIVGVSGVGPGGYTSGSGYYSEGSYDDYSDTGYAA